VLAARTALVAAAIAAPAGPASPAGLRPPVTRVEVVRDTLHGAVIADPYRWLEDKNSPETRAWLAEQDRYFHAVMDPVPGREAIRRRLSELLRTDDVSLPLERAGRLFFLRRSADADQRALVMRSGGRDVVLFDPQVLSPDHTVSLRLLDVSDDGTLAVIGVQQGGEDEIAIQFLDVATRKVRAESLPKARYFGFDLAPDGKAGYYARYGREGSRIFRHALGTDPSLDVLIFGDGLPPEIIASQEVSDDGAWMLITVARGSAADDVKLYVKDLRHDGPVIPIVDDVKVHFEGHIGGNTLYIKTNWEALDSRILAVDLLHPERDRWREVVKEAPNAIDGWALCGGHLLVRYLVNVVAMLYAFDADGRLLGPVPIGDLGSVREMRGQWGRPDAWMFFESYLVPPRILRVKAATAAVTEWWKPSVPFDGDAFETRQDWYHSKDGTRIPMFVVGRKGLQRDGSHPVYLTGYGGFMSNETPRFRALTALWMESGGVLAVPNLRGGSEFGDGWHRAGMLQYKQNVFDDFLAAAQYLVDRRYTSTDRLAIAGGSNGGLLVGAALTQRPDLFKAVVCSVPLLDMLRYHRFLIARFWVPEYGSSDDPKQFEYLRAYSPYHHVSEGVKYPATLLVSGDSDTRVDPLHARKMTALLQASTGGEAPILLHYDTQSGHSGGKPIRQQIEDDADVLHFLFWQCGLTPGAGGARSGGGARSEAGARGGTGGSR
jgi:prolyl oligopeptidase